MAHGNLLGTTLPDWPWPRETPSERRRRWTREAAVARGYPYLLLALRKTLGPFDHAYRVIDPLCEHDVELAEDLYFGEQGTEDLVRLLQVRLVAHAPLEVVVVGFDTAQLAWRHARAASPLSERRRLEGFSDAVAGWLEERARVLGEILKEASARGDRRLEDQAWDVLERTANAAFILRDDSNPLYVHWDARVAKRYGLRRTG